MSLMPMEARNSGLEKTSWNDVQSELPRKVQGDPKGVVSGKQRRRIFVANGFWWYEDSFVSSIVRLDPVFVKCGWQMGKLAKALGLGEKTLSRLVENSLGIRGKTWLRQVRIVSIRRSLSADVKIENVASDFGFGQHSDFTREFKTLVGVTPSIFVRSEREKWNFAGGPAAMSIFS